MVKVLIVDDQVLIRAGMAAILRAAPGYEVVGEACDGTEAVTMAALTEPDVVLMDIRMPDMDGIAATRAILGSGRENLPRILILTTFDMDQYVYEALRAGADGFVLKDTPPERLLAALKAVADGDTLFSSTVTRRLVQAYVTATGLDGDPQGPGPGAGTLPSGLTAPVPAAPGLRGGSGSRGSSGGSGGSHGSGGSAEWPPAGFVPRSRRPDGPSSAERAALAALTTRETDVLRLVATGLSNGEIAEKLVVSEGTVKTHLNRAMAKLNLSSRAQAVVLAYESGLVVAGQAQVQV